MNIQNDMMSTRRTAGASGEQIISLATLAVGGQGGGVLTNWIVAVAQANGYLVQSTSVAGVAQRTGATIYYVEMCPDTGNTPVFTLAPAEQDVDILIASELMEAGRAVMRGFSSSEFTTLIASTHRISAISEKISPGDGRVDDSGVIEAMNLASDKLIAFDMEKIARDAGTIISSSLFGALAGSGALPFPRESFEEVIKSSRGAAATLRAFSAAYELAQQGTIVISTEDEAAETAHVTGPEPLQEKWRALTNRISALPPDAQEMARLGLEKVVDFQDVEYGSEYLDRLERFVPFDHKETELTQTAAKYLAKAMCYDDVIRVADIKTRAYRLQRVEDEIEIKDDQLLHLTEYFHPRFEEVYLGLPAELGKRVSNSKGLRRFFDRYLDKGRRIRTNKLSGFLMLWLVSSMRPWRRKLLRHKIEVDHMERWLDFTLTIAKTDVALAVEILGAHRLIKGYSDTHNRGLSKFDKVVEAAKSLNGRPDAADWLRRLKAAALDDVEGKQLDDALKTVATFLK